MGRKRAAVPRYRNHVSGHARVTFAGKTYYLGRYDSPESHAKYAALLSEYVKTGQAPKLVPDVDRRITVGHLVVEFAVRYIAVREGEDKGRFDTLTRTSERLERYYGDVPAEEFGPRLLSDLRDRFVEYGWSRKYVNESIRSVVRIFNFAVSRELIKPEQVRALESLEPLVAGETKAKDYPPQLPVPMQDISKTLPHISPTMAAMVRVQLASGCRPSEMYELKPDLIDMSDETAWIYRPKDHKTAHKKKHRALVFNNDAQKALQPFLDRPGDRYCFSSDEAGLMKICSNSYAQAIKRGCKRAGVEPWSPYRLRHTTATAICDALGLEAAAAMLGHSGTAVTRIYTVTAEEDAKKAAQFAPRLPDPEA